MISLRQVSKAYPFGPEKRPLHALKDVSFDIPEGSFTCVIGPSGCGKTSLLRIAAGLRAPSSGEVLHNGKSVRGPHPDRAVIFQQYALFPWMNVLGNIEFGLKAKGLDAAARRIRAARYVDLVRLNGFENAYPHQLSGGMKQRVAIARALAPEPDVVLMDEPFAALDSLTREAMQDELILIREQTRKTFLLVTHNIDEAVFLGDRVIVMTERPGMVKAVVDVALPRPRAADLRTDDRSFLDYRHSLSTALRSEMKLHVA